MAAFFVAEEICLAAARGDLQHVKRLLERGVNINIMWEDKTPLHYATLGGHIDIVTYLVEMGADINARDKDARTPLHFASLHGHLNVVQYLTERGADINAKDCLGRTPLHWAAREGHLKIVQYLVKMGADVNARDVLGGTPLHEAATYGRLEVVRFLLEAGAEPNIQDKVGKTPADWARFNGFEEIADLIEDYARKRYIEFSRLISYIEATSLVEGEWGLLRVKVNTPSTLNLDGDLEWMNPGKVEDIANIPVKPKKAGRIPILVTVKSDVGEERRIVWVEVMRRWECHKCGARRAPDANYCWNCGAKLT